MKREDFPAALNRRTGDRTLTQAEQRALRGYAELTKDIFLAYRRGEMTKEFAAAMLKAALYAALANARRAETDKEEE